ncbi:MAG: hypothetical protein WA830_13465 [Candidatus Sulfotelmatobacter sp.]
MHSTNELFSNAQAVGVESVLVVCGLRVLPPKVHGGAHTLRVLDLLCGVSKQQVAGIHAEGHWNALNHAAD